MEMSFFLAKFWGWYLIVFFVILSFNPSRIKQIIEYAKDQKFAILTSFLAITIGLINILLHNVWQANWRIIITLLGWIALFKGLIMFTYPLGVLKRLEILNVKFLQVVYVFLLLCGLYLLNMGYELIPFEGY